MAMPPWENIVLGLLFVPVVAAYLLPLFVPDDTDGSSDAKQEDGGRGAAEGDGDADTSMR